MRILRDTSEEEMVLASLIVLTFGNKLYLILEGHCRATAYALLPEAFGGTETYVGFCSTEAMFRKAPKLIIGAGQKENNC